MDARNPSALSAIHSCCLVAGLRAHPPPEAACALVDHVPREEWHIRHLRQMEAPCRTQHLAFARYRHSDDALRYLQFPPSYELPRAPLPTAWAAEVAHAAKRMIARVAAEVEE